MEIEKLKQLIIFSEKATLSAAADTLHISQPTLTRAMQSIENDLGVEIFDRQKNKLSLNDTGLYMVDYAKRLLSYHDEMIHHVKEFDRRKKTINIGSIAPAPLWSIVAKLNEINPDMNVYTELAAEDNLLKGLSDGTYNIIVLTEENCTCNNIFENNYYITEYYENEYLYVTLPTNHRLASRESISLVELDGESMILYSKTGIWHHFHTEIMPHSKVIYQNDREVFNEIVEKSSFISFMSNLSIKQYPIPKNRVLIPISDRGASKNYYMVRQKK